MTDRDRLIELITHKQNWGQAFEKSIYTRNISNSELADFLLENGVIVPPCKVGDTVYVTYAGYVTTAKVLALYTDREGGMSDLQIKTKCENVVGFKMVIDKDNYAFSDVFLTEEEAEEKLKELNDNG